MIANKALKCLQKLGMQARIKPGRRPDALPIGAAIWLLGNPALEVLAVEEPLRDQDVEHLAPELPRLWIAGHVPERKAKEWIAEDRAFADAVGNAFLNFPGLMVRILGNKPKQTTQRKARREWRGATIRLLFHLLCDENLAQLPVRALANLVRTATGTVQQLLDDLEATGNLIRVNNRERRLRADRPLIDRWIQEYTRKVYPDNLIGRFNARAAGWHRGLELAPIHAKWGAEPAAEILGADLRPGIRTIYVAEPVAPLLKAAQLHKAPDGDVEIRRIFWDCNLPAPLPNIAPPLLVVADLLATRDGRCMTAAAEIRKTFLDGTA